MKARPFELALWIGFGVLGVLALILLSTYSGSGEAEPPAANAIFGTVTIWGTLPSVGMVDVIDQISETNETFKNVSYRQINPQSFGIELLQALADQRPPDLVLLPHELLATYRNRLRPYSYEQFTERNLRDQYLDGASIFALPEGVYGIPLMVDPLMMYWNRNTLTSQGFLTPPTSWEQLLSTYFPRLISRTADRSIDQAVVAMGSVRNVTNATPTIYSLFLQGGSQGVNVQGGELTILLDSRRGEAGRPFLNAVNFFTRFSTFNNIYYSWNQSLPSDRDMFLQEDLALYFGFGSEARELERRNPNLNFDIAEMPQGAEATLRRTYGRFYSLALLDRAPNPTSAMTVLSVLSSDQVVAQLAAIYGVAPAKRSLVIAGSSDLYGRAIYQSAPIAYGWLSPEPGALQSIMTDMIEEITNERKPLSEAVNDGLERIQLAY